MDYNEEKACELIERHQLSPVFEFRQDDGNDRLLLIRNKFPKFQIEIQDDCDLKQLSDALRAVSEFTSKYDKIYGRNKR